MTRPLILIGAIMLAAGCGRSASQEAVSMVGGDPVRGRQQIVFMGCASCHTIPGVPGAAARVGPTLEHIALRAYIGDTLPNTPHNMIQWVQNTHAANPKSAMPDLHINESDARDIATYLYTLR